MVIRNVENNSIKLLMNIQNFLLLVFFFLVGVGMFFMCEKNKKFESNMQVIMKVINCYFSFILVKVCMEVLFSILFCVRKVEYMIRMKVRVQKMQVE